MKKTYEEWCVVMEIEPRVAIMYAMLFEPLWPIRYNLDKILES